LKLYPNILSGIIYSLKIIFQENKYTDDVLEKTFRNHKQWGARDRRFIAECVYDCVRWWRFYSECASVEKQDVRLIENVLAVHLLKSGFEIPEWYAKTSIPATEILSKLSKNSFNRKIKESIPDWLNELGEKELGKNWDKQLHALNLHSKVILRSNKLKTSIIELEALLVGQQIEVETISTFEDALVLKKRQNLNNLELYKSGMFEFQDAGSQAIAPFLEVVPGMKVIDACAGGGGKTLHLAALMQNKGQIIALDVEMKKLNNLKERAKRAGTSIVTTELISDKILEKFHQSADRLLLDVPCSGLGVLKRNPDAKWKLSLDEVERVKLIQKKILQTYTSMLKKGGKMVYATCSILPSENNEQVRNFLIENAEKYELLEEKQIWPSDGYDGFYMARILKK